MPASGHATDARAGHRRACAAGMRSTRVRPVTMTTGGNGGRAGDLQAPGYLPCAPGLQLDSQRAHRGRPAADVRANLAPASAPALLFQSTSGYSTDVESTTAACVNSLTRPRCIPVAYGL